MDFHNALSNDGEDLGVLIGKNIFSSMLTDQKKSTVINALKQVMRLYCGKGHDIESVAFKAQNNPVHMIQADNELQAMKEKLKTEGVIQVSKHCHER